MQKMHKINKAIYTTATVPYGWEGALMNVMDQWTDQWTDQWMDQRTDQQMDRQSDLLSREYTTKKIKKRNLE